MKLMISTVLLFLTLHLSAADNFDCITMDALNKNDSVRSTSASPYKIEIVDGVTHLCPTGFIEVILMPINAGDTLKSYIIQTRQMGIDMALGTWRPITDTHSRSYGCFSQDDTLCQMQAESPPVNSVIGLWTAPNDEGGYKVDIRATVMDEHNRYWMDVHSVELYINKTSECHPIVIDEEETANNAAREDELTAQWEAKQAELLKQEIANSEGDWQKRDEEEKRAHEEEIQKEMMDYEIKQQQEEEARRARIQAEIRDKEEHDSLIQHEEEEEVPDKPEEEIPGDGETDGSSRALASVLSIVLVFVIGRIL